MSPEEWIAAGAALCALGIAVPAAAELLLRRWYKNALADEEKRPEPGDGREK